MQAPLGSGHGLSVFGTFLNDQTPEVEWSRARVPSLPYMRTPIVQSYGYASPPCTCLIHVSFAHYYLLGLARFTIHWIENRFKIPIWERFWIKISIHLVKFFLVVCSNLEMNIYILRDYCHVRPKMPSRKCSFPNIALWGPYYDMQNVPEIATLIPQLCSPRVNKTTFKQPSRKCNYLNISSCGAHIRICPCA